MGFGLQIIYLVVAFFQQVDAIEHPSLAELEECGVTFVVKWYV